MKYDIENSLSLYNAFRAFGKNAEENQNYSKVIFEHNDQKYVVYLSRQSATKATRIYCEEDNTVYWEQHYIMGGMCTPSVVKKALVKPVRSADEIAIVVIKGKPGLIAGLDEGIWVSAKKGRLNKASDVFVMSEAVFKVFTSET